MSELGVFLFERRQVVARRRVRRNTLGDWSGHWVKWRSRGELRELGAFSFTGESGFGLGFGLRLLPEDIHRNLQAFG
jgi:hypothetical protein